MTSFADFYLKYFSLNDVKCSFSGILKKGTLKKKRKFWKKGEILKNGEILENIEIF